MIRAGLALWVLLAAGSPSRAQTVYLQPQQRGFSAVFQTTHTPRTTRRGESEPLATTGVGLTGAIDPRMELSVQLSRQRSDRDSEDLGLFTVLATGWFKNNEQVKLGLFAGLTTIRGERRDTEHVATIGLGFAQSHRVSPLVSVVPQFVTSVTTGPEATAFVVGATPAVRVGTDEFGLFVEPSLGYELGTQLTTVGIALGVFRGF